MKGYINSIETMGLVDGPGIRFVVFMQGCKLRCLYCHNPETWSKKSEFALTAQELVKRILKYKNYYGKEGGVTFSGGEPLLQPEFLIEALKLCKQCHIHTCIDTAGFGYGCYEEILRYTDLVIMDIKALENESYMEMTGQKIEESLHFLDVCQKLNKKMWIRQVIVPGINDNEAYIIKLKQFISTLNNIEKVEFLPYSTIGVPKYETLNIPYRLNKVPAMDQKRCQELYSFFETL